MLCNPTASSEAANESRAPPFHATYAGDALVAAEDSAQLPPMQPHDGARHSRRMDSEMVETKSEDRPRSRRSRSGTASARARHRLCTTAVRRGGGGQAQFSHPDLGGMGQWSRGGMTQVGDMFNNSLKAQVAAACQDLALLAAGEGAAARSGMAQAPTRRRCKAAASVTGGPTIWARRRPRVRRTICATPVSRSVEASGDRAERDGDSSMTPAITG